MSESVFRFFTRYSTVGISSLKGDTKKPTLLKATTPNLALLKLLINSIALFLANSSLFGYISSASIDFDTSMARSISVVLLLTFTSPFGITGLASATTINIKAKKRNIFLPFCPILPSLIFSLFSTSFE